MTGPVTVLLFAGETAAVWAAAVLAGLACATLGFLWLLRAARRYGRRLGAACWQGLVGESDRE